MLFGQDIDKTELAQLCQRAEREFVGVPVGIMDQYVSVFGEENRAIKIDCRSLTHETAQLPREAAIIVVNSMVKHELGDSAYKTRVRNAPRPWRRFSRLTLKCRVLRDVSSQLLDSRAESSMPETCIPPGPSRDHRG